VPSTVLFLAKSPLVGQFDLSSLRDVSSGAAPLDEELSKALTERIPSISWFRQGETHLVTPAQVFNGNQIKYEPANALSQ